MKFEIVGEITNIETIAAGNSIRILRSLNEKYGKGRWRKKKGLATVKLNDESFRLAEIHWYEAHGIGKKDFKIKFPFFRLIMNKVRFVVCLDNKEYAASLEVGKLYQVIPDKEAEKIGGLRVIDEDGEDYLFDADMFCAVQVPLIAAQKLVSLSKQG